MSKRVYTVAAAGCMHQYETDSQPLQWAEYLCKVCGNKTNLKVQSSTLVIRKKK
jgi:hypothetical protein